MTPTIGRGCLRGSKDFVKFEIDREFESPNFVRSGFFRRFEMSVISNVNGEEASGKDRFARCEMRMWVSAQECSIVWDVVKL